MIKIGVKKQSGKYLEMKGVYMMEYLSLVNSLLNYPITSEKKQKTHIVCYNGSENNNEQTQHKTIPYLFRLYIHPTNGCIYWYIIAHIG
jgi:hypothetical protein